MDKNIETLKTIIEENADTEYGRRFGFSSIASPEDYQSRVPLTIYDDYGAYMERIEAGEKGVLFSSDYKILSFCHTSGTTGFTGKLISITDRMMNLYGNDLDAYPRKVYEEVGGKASGAKRLFQQTFRVKPGDSESQVLISEMFYKYKREYGYLDPDTYLGGDILLFDTETEDVFFARSYAALACEDIVMMEAFYQYDHLRFFTYLEKNHEKLLKAIKTRVIPDDIRISSRVRDYLTGLQISPERISLLEKELDGDMIGIAKRLWPRLRLLTGISNKSVKAENDMLLEYANGVSQYYNYYMSTEGYVGDCFAENDLNYRMVPGRCFVEFLPYDDDVGQHPLLPDKLVRGHMYEPVITSFGGMYRYRMGDVIKVTGFMDSFPTFEVMGRKNQTVSIAGERTSIIQIEKMADRFRDDGISFSMYCVGPYFSRMKTCYRMVVSGLDSDISESELALLMDKYLAVYNPSYGNLRRMELIDPPEVKIISTDKYFTFLVNNNILKGNTKPVHMTVNGFSEW